MIFNSIDKNLHIYQIKTQYHTLAVWETFKFFISSGLWPEKNASKERKEVSRGNYIFQFIELEDGFSTWKVTPMRSKP